MLHPSHKLQYFERARWPADWISDAKEMLYDDFNMFYHDAAPEHEEDEPLAGDTDREELPSVPGSSQATRRSRSAASVAVSASDAIPEVRRYAVMPRSHPLTIV